MVTRTTSRSQRAQVVSHTRFQPPRGTQPGPSQTYRGKRRSTLAEEDDEDGSEEENGGDDMEMDGDAGQDADILGGDRVGQSDIRRKANELVRLALFTEHKRIPLKRDEIAKKVMGSNSRAFALVFDQAQDTLKKTFGMELAELPSRAALEAGAEEPEDDLGVARKATGMKKRAAAAGSKTYILRSVLDPLLIEHAAQTDEHILEAECADIPDSNNDDDDDDEPSDPRCYGSILSWSHSDCLGPLGILYTLLALILVSGRTMSDIELRSQLKRLCLAPNSRIRFPEHATTHFVSIEQHLGTLIRQGYLDRSQVGTGEASGPGAKKGGAGSKRGRVSLGGGINDDGDAGGPSYEWRWGVRAMSEVGEKAIAKWIAQFMVRNVGGEDDEDEDDDDDDGQANGRKRGTKTGKQRREGLDQKFEKMLKGVEKAAGGTLDDVQ